MARTGAGHGYLVTRTLTHNDGVLEPAAGNPHRRCREPRVARRPPPPGKAWLHSGSLRSGFPPQRLLLFDQPLRAA
jgi:hypothetical protein